MSIISVCAFPVTLNDGTVLPAAANPLVFTPKLEGDDAIPTLMGLTVPEGVSAESGNVYLVPRLAAAWDWAPEGAQLVCVPLTGTRDPAGGFTLAPGSELEPLPCGISVQYPTSPLPGNFAANEIQRMVKGPFTIVTRNAGQFPPAAGAENNDGQIVLPALEEGKVAVILPQDGAIIEAFKAAHPKIAVLVTSAVGADRKVDLYRVA